jgi:hypothetical protein
MSELVPCRVDFGIESSIEGSLIDGGLMKGVLKGSLVHSVRIGHVVERILLNKILGKYVDGVAMLGSIRVGTVVDDRRTISIVARCAIPDGVVSSVLVPGAV